MSAPIKLPAWVLGLLTRLEQAGFSGYAVGGCVRDLLRGKAPADYDLCTDASPAQMKEIFSDFPCLPTGLKHGTLTVLAEGRLVEITTFRTDGEYSDGRRPDCVSFTSSVTEDLARRDFTVNAMAYSPRAGLVDPFGGQKDLRAGVLRCVGAPERRFAEDSLRILRGVRFSSVLGFSVEENTDRALRALASTLARVSPERTAAELKKLLCGEDARRVLLSYPDVLGIVLPEILPMVGCGQENPYHCYDVWEHTAAAVEAIPPAPALRLTMLFHDCGKPACAFRGEDGFDHFYGHAKLSAALAEKALTRLRLDRQTVETVTQLCRLHDRDIAPTRPAVKRLLNQIGTARLEQFLLVKEADTRAQSALAFPRLAQQERVRQIAAEILSQGECFSRRDLAVDGNDMLSCGVPAGEAVGKTLAYLLDAVVGERLPNEKAALLAAVREERPWT